MYALLFNVYITAKGVGGSDFENLPTDPTRFWGVLGVMIILGVLPFIPSWKSKKPGAEPTVGSSVIINGTVTPNIDSSSALLSSVVGNVEERARVLAAELKDLEARYVAVVREAAKSEVRVEILTRRVQELESEVQVLTGRLMGSGR